MIINLTKKNIIAHRPITAISFFERGRGMIGRRFDDFDAMIFNRCNSIHTMFMSIKIDVLFLNSENIICDFRKELVPWIPFVKVRNAQSVIELPAGVIEKTEIEIGNCIDLNAELTAKQYQELKKQILSTPEVIVPIKDQVK